MRVLVLSPHTDDAELGCGGTIVKHLEGKDDVFCVIFSMINPSIKPESTLAKELHVSMEIIGSDYDACGYIMREFGFQRQDILQHMVDLKHAFGPDRVYLPSSSDLHQDHIVISNEGIRAFKDITTLGYELPWNNLKFNPQAFVKLKARHVNKKIQALAAYKSQKEKPYMHHHFTAGLTIARGGQIGAQYAEAFEVIRWIQD